MVYSLGYYCIFAFWESVLHILTSVQPPSLDIRKALGLRKSDSKDAPKANSTPGSAWDSFRTLRTSLSENSAGIPSGSGEDCWSKQDHNDLSSSPSQISPSPARSVSQTASTTPTKNPLGLTVLHSPSGYAKADVVFIHGLGGSSQTTWSKDKDLDLFWPKTFLSTEKDINSARIMTFGYNSELFNGPTSVSIVDFARDLLFNLRYSTGDGGHALHIGDVCTKYPSVYQTTNC